MSRWQSFLRQTVILWAGGLVGAVAVLPFLLHMQAATLEKANSKGLTVPVLVAAVIIQNGVLLTIAVPVGLWAAYKLFPCERRQAKPWRLAAACPKRPSLCCGPRSSPVF